MDSSITQQEKVRENRLRRMADRQGLQLSKSRTRDPRALDYGRWLVVERDGARVELANADAVERYLMGEHDHAS